MKIWNLSSFEDVAPTVMAAADKEASASFRGPRKRRFVRSMSAGGLSTMVVVAALATLPVQMNVCGSGTTVHIESIASMTNVESDRPPLELLFSADHPLKWDQTRERAMLEKAAEALTSANVADRTAENVVSSLLREGLPSDRDHSVDIADLGIKLS